VHRLKNQRGQALVEFALILPILLAIMIGIFDFGAAYNQKNDLNFLANQAARYAEVNACAACGTNQTISQYVLATADTKHVQNTATISFCLPPLSGGGTNDGSVGDPLRITASAPFNWLGILTSAGLPSGSTAMKSTVTVRILTASDGTHYSAAAC
jgi:Flp pilus assembly protein TadG